eukprot:COSAG02_NODE_37054_length_447_cov_0.695402_1_plen_139_part_10
MVQNYRTKVGRIPRLHTYPSLRVDRADAVAMAIALPMLLIASLGTAGPRGRHSQTPGSGKASSGGVAGPDHSVLERFRAVVEQAAHFDRTGRKMEAAKQYREAVQLWPEFETGHFNLAMSLQETGHLSEAQHHFARTLE